MRSACTRRPIGVPLASICSPPGSPGSRHGRGRWSRVPWAVRWEAITDMDVRSYIAQNAGSFFDDLKEWLRIPSISADPARHSDVRASADWLAAHLRATGFPEVEIWETGT